MGSAPRGVGQVEPPDAHEAARQDGEGQRPARPRLSLPVSGLLVALKVADRDRMMVSGALNVMFVATFVSIITLARPVDTMFSIQRSIYTELALKPLDPAVRAVASSVMGLGGAVSASNSSLGTAASSSGQSVPTLESRAIPHWKAFRHVADWLDFWVWAESVLYDTVFSCCYYNGSALADVHGGTNDLRVATFNRLITPVRFRQVRSRQDQGCSTEMGSHELSRPCWGEFELSTEDRASSWNNSFGLASHFLTSLASSLVGSPEDGQDYGDSAHVVDLPLDRAGGATRLSEMLRQRWTDESTRAVGVDVNLYNPTYDIATVIRFKVDVVLGGRFFPHVEVLSCRLNPYSNTTDYIRLVLEILFILLLLFYLQSWFRKLCLQGFGRYFSRFWTYVELLSLGCFVYSVVLWVEYLLTNRDHFRHRSESEFFDLYPLADLFNKTAAVGAFNVVWSSVKLLRHLRLWPRFLLIWNVVKESLKYVIPLAAVIVMITMSFAFSGHWLFGHRVGAFHTWPLALSTLLRVFMDELDYDNLRDAHPEMAPIWTIAWIFIMQFVLLNMFIAILTASYDHVQKRNRKLDIFEHQGTMPPLSVHLKAKCPKALLLPRPDEETAAQILQTRTTLKNLRDRLGVLDSEMLWTYLQQKLVDDSYTITANELAPFFHRPPEHGRLCDWVSNFSELLILDLGLGQDEGKSGEFTSTLEETRALKGKVLSLEAEIIKVNGLLGILAPSHPDSSG